MTARRPAGSRHPTVPPHATPIPAPPLASPSPSAPRPCASSPYPRLFRWAPSWTCGRTRAPCRNCGRRARRRRRSPSRRGSTWPRPSPLSNTSSARHSLKRASRTFSTRPFALVRAELAQRHVDPRRVAHARRHGQTRHRGWTPLPRAHAHISPPPAARPSRHLPSPPSWPPALTTPPLLTPPPLLLLAVLCPPMAKKKKGSKCSIL